MRYARRVKQQDRTTRNADAQARFEAGQTAAENDGGHLVSGTPEQLLQEIRDLAAAAGK